MFEGLATYASAGDLRNRLAGLRPQGLGGIGFHVFLRPGDGGVLVYGQSGDGVWERIAKVGVLGAAAVAGPPTCVDRKLHQVREAADLLGAGGLAAGQGAELVEVDGVGAFGGEVVVDEILVRQFVFCVVVDVLGHVAVKLGQDQSIARASAGLSVGVSGNQLARQRGKLSVLNSSEFRVLQPEIAFDNFCGGKEAEDGGITGGEGVAALLCAEKFGAENTACGQGCAGHADAF